MSGTLHSTNAPSRGNLVEAVLSNAACIPSPDSTELARFNGFNLAMIAEGEAWVLTNVPEPTKRPLDHGICGLSNGRLSSHWPKVAMLEAELAKWMDSNGSTSDLLDVLSLSTRFDPLHGEPGSGLPLFVQNKVYGTRCSTVVAVSADGAGSITERRFDEKGGVTGETRLTFQWALPEQA